MPTAACSVLTGRSLPALSWLGLGAALLTASCGSGSTETGILINLANLPRDVDYAILEMGMNHFQYLKIFLHFCSILSHAQTFLAPYQSQKTMTKRFRAILFCNDSNQNLEL